jgi:hypothetical protein
MISMAVGCREWLRAGIDVLGRFSDAITYVASYASNSKRKTAVSNVVD